MRLAFRIFVEQHQSHQAKLSSVPTLVFILANGLTNGGVTTWAINTSRRMAGIGQKSLIVAHDPEDGGEEFSRKVEDQIRPCPGNASGHLPQPKEIKNFASCYGAIGDAILFPNWSWGTWASVASMMRRPSQRQRVIGIAHTDEKGYYDKMIHYEPIISKFIAVSDQIYQHLLQQLPTRRHDITRLPYPIAKRQARERPKTQKDCLRIGYAGRIQQYQKRILDLKLLAADLSLRKGDYFFEVAGNGTHLEELKEYFEHNRFKNVSVNFLGLIDADAIPVFWSTVDVGILFSSHEGLSISMVESMAAGCVQLVTNVSGVSDTVKPGISGFIHEIGDTEAMAKSLQTLLEQPDLLSRMSVACIDHVQLHHDPDRYDSKLLELARQAWQEPQRKWPRFRRLIPESVVAEQRLRRKARTSISLRGRIKLKCLDLARVLRVKQ
jgi:glycosyltransferase involved in cell wall biosynthesis